MPRPDAVQRRQGACSQCRKLKRKCDQKHPQCSQCQKKFQACSLQIFKIKTLQNSQPSGRPCPVSEKNSLPQIRVTSAKDIDASPQSPVPPSSPRLSQDQDASSTPQWDSNPPLDTESSPATGGWGLRISSGGMSDQDEGSSCMGPITKPVFDDMEVVLDEIVPVSTDRDLFEASTRGVHTLQIGRTYLQLPSDLLRSTVRRLLWDYFVNRASQIFLCWEPDDAQLDKRYNDPYTETLPAIAVESGPMMLASLALSAFHYAGGGWSREDHSLVTSLMLEASHALAASRWQGPQTFKQLLATVGTASFLYLLKPSLYSDMLPLSRTAALCLMTDPKWQNIKEPSYQVIMQIFRWSDICAQLSLKRFVPIPDEHMQLLLELRENERAASLSSSYADWFVHPLYAFAEDFIPPLRRIAWLCRTRQQGCIMAAQATESSDESCLGQNHDDVETASASDVSRISRDRFEALVEELERTISAASGKVHLDQYLLHCSPELNAPDLRTDLSRLAGAMESAIVILFFTRLRDTPWTTPLIRYHVQNVVDSLSSIAADSRFSNGVVFPLYVAGLEAIDMEHRSRIINRMKHLPGIWSQREPQLVACLQQVWKLRDADPGAVWNSWIHQGMSNPVARQAWADASAVTWVIVANRFIQFLQIVKIAFQGDFTAPLGFV